jgi:hypothetical protein
MWPAALTRLATLAPSPAMREKEGPDAQRREGEGRGGEMR